MRAILFSMAWFQILQILKGIFGAALWPRSV